jgi:hypothetical protein
MDLYDGIPHVFQIRPETAEISDTKAALKKHEFLK